MNRATMLIAVFVAELVLTGCPEVLEGVGQVSTGDTTSSPTSAGSEAWPSSPGTESGEDGVLMTSGDDEGTTTSAPVTSAAEDETGDSTAVDTSGASETGTTASSGNTTGTAEPDPCQECVEAACPEEYAACQMARGCSCYAECYREVADEETCANACGIDQQPAEFDALLACFFDSGCGMACS